MLTIAILTLIGLVNFLAAAYFVRLGARWVNAARATFPRAMAATASMWLLGIGAAVVDYEFLGRVVRDGDPTVPLLQAALLHFALFLLNLVLFFVIIRWFMRTSLPRAALIWLTSFIPGILALAAVFLIVKPFILEAFVMPNNSMSPTIAGPHKIGTCPHCGATAFVSATLPLPEQLVLMEEESAAICTQCFKSSVVKPLSDERLPGDRFIVNKPLTPHRWDIIVFRYPSDPSLKYVMRLVALPGEVAFIKDGAVWVNGEKLSPPESIANLRYTTGQENGAFQAFQGIPDNPWRLKADEYCVLGDFSERSSDSRYWGLVPAANIEGVVDVRYWPMSRWHIWR